MQRVRPKKLIVLSNYTIDECFVDSRDADPIKRRFRQLRFPQQLQEVEQRRIEFAVQTSILSGDSNCEDAQGSENQASEVSDVDTQPAGETIPTPDTEPFVWPCNFSSDDYLSFLNY